MANAAAFLVIAVFGYLTSKLSRVGGRQGGDPVSAPTKLQVPDGRGGVTSHDVNSDDPGLLEVMRQLSISQAKMSESQRIVQERLQEKALRIDDQAKHIDGLEVRVDALEDERNHLVDEITFLRTGIEKGTIPPLPALSQRIHHLFADVDFR